MKRRISIFIKVLLTFVGALLCTCLILIGIFFYLNTTNRINNVARNFLNKHVAGYMYFEDLKFDFSKFPTVRLTANNGYMISHLNKIPTDTLARFKHLDAEMDLSYLLADSLTIYIPRVEVTDGFALATIGKDHVPGWNVWLFKKKKTEPAGVHHHHKTKLYIEHVKLKGKNHFLYYNFRRMRSMDIYGEDVSFDGEIRIKYRQIYVSNFTGKNIHAHFNFNEMKSHVKVDVPEIRLTSKYANKLRYYDLKVTSNSTLVDIKGLKIFNGEDCVRLNVNVGTDFNKNIYEVKSLNLNLNNDLELGFNGNVNLEEKKVKIGAKASSKNVRELLEKYKGVLEIGKKLPKFTMPLSILLDATGDIDFHKRIFPNIKMTLAGNNGIFETRYGEIRNIRFLAKTDLDYNNISKAYLLLDTLNFDWLHSTVSIKGIVKKGKEGVKVETQFNGGVSIPDIRSLINLQMNVQGHLYSRGSFTGEFDESGSLRDNYNISFADSIRFKDIKFRIPHTEAHVSVARASLKINTQGSPDSIRVKLSIPKTIINSYNEALINLGRLDISTNIADFKKNSMPNFDKGNLVLANASLITNSRDTIKMNHMVAQFHLWNEKSYDPKVSYFTVLENISLTNPDSALVYVKDISILSEASLYSWVTITPQSIYKLWDIIGNWQYAGVLNLRGLHFTLPQLPLYNRIDSAAFSFTERNASIEKLSAKFGETSIKAKVEVDNWHNYIFSDSILKATGEISTDKANMTQLIPAVASGVAFNNTLKQKKEVSVKHVTKFAAVPTNLDVTLHVNARNANYGLGYLDTALATIRIIPQLLKFQDVKFKK